MLRQKRWLTRILRDRLFGFLLGSTLAGASVYYYILEEYKVSNEMLTEDIYVRAIPSQLFVLRYSSYLRHGIARPAQR
jgi:hypothetical protein